MATIKSIRRDKPRKFNKQFQHTIHKPRVRYYEKTHFGNELKKSAGVVMDFKCNFS